MKKVKFIFDYKVLGCIQFFILLSFTYTLFRLNVLSFIYTALITGVLLVVNCTLFVGNRKNSIISKIVTIILCVLLVIPVVYMSESRKTLDEITEVNDEISRIYLIVKKDSQYHNVQDLEDKVIQINTKYNAVAMGAAMNELNEWIQCDYKSEDDFIKMATNLNDGDVDAILVNEAYLWVMEHKYEKFSEDTRVIWTYEYKKEKEDIKKPVAVVNETFNVFISGIDAEGDVSTVSRSDVNMLVTVNTSTNQILLTSIPRDYYVYISELGAKDKLTHAGLNGINSSVSTVENLMDIEINYYVKVNFTSLIMMVDALGGIDVNVPYTVGRPGWSSYAPQGMNHMDGEKALAYSRERYDLPNGDNDRIKNQQRVIQSMLNKLISPTIITNYMDILDAVAGSFETNMSTKEITSLLKGQLENMKAWDVQSYSLTGEGSYFKGGAMMPDTELYYCIPNKASVQKVTDYINSMMGGEFIILD